MYGKKHVPNHQPVIALVALGKRRCLRVLLDTLPRKLNVAAVYIFIYIYSITQHMRYKICKGHSYCELNWYIEWYTYIYIMYVYIYIYKYQIIIVYNCVSYLYSSRCLGGTLLGCKGHWSPAAQAAPSRGPRNLRGWSCHRNTMKYVMDMQYTNTYYIYMCVCDIYIYICMRYIYMIYTCTCI